MTRLMIEGRGCGHSWIGNAMLFASVYAFCSGAAYGASAYYSGLLLSSNAYQLFYILGIIVFSLVMINFIVFRSAVLMAIVDVFCSFLTFPALISFISLAYYLQFSNLQIALVSIFMISFTYWSQSQEVKHLPISDYLKQGIDNQYFRVENSAVVYEMRHRSFVMNYFKHINYPHKDFSKLIRGAAIVIGIIVIPFGQKEVFANTSGEYQNMPLIAMIVTFVFFVGFPHQFSSSVMLIKLNRALKRGEIDLSKYETSGDTPES